jgi:hypothetical protein
MDNRDDEIVQLLKEIHDSHREFAELWGKTASHQIEVQRAFIKRQKAALSAALFALVVAVGAMVWMMLR